MKFHYTCKFDPSLMVLLNDDEELMRCSDSMTVIIVYTCRRIPNTRMV